VDGPVHVAGINLFGDEQSDLTVHGGLNKAVYGYPSEHYEYWRGELPGTDLDWGAFGENLTVEGCSEETISVGDQIKIGTSIFQVTQPRLPCFKLAAKFERDDIIKRMLHSRRTGFYLRVLQEGWIQSGDSIVISERDPARLTIRELTDLYLNKNPNRSSIERVLSVRALSEAWHDHFKGITTP